MILADLILVRGIDPAVSEGCPGQSPYLREISLDDRRTVFPDKALRQFHPERTAVHAHHIDY